ncbi:MAG: alkaline phosphatase family protein [Candidatus Njordarchaeia archaeon]
MKKVRVILIGIDGADYYITRKFIQMGELPNLQKISINGIFSKLKSTIPPLSPSAWTSIFTGVPPSKHGIYSFTKRQKNSYFPRMITSKDRRVDAIWNILSSYGKRSILINIPFSYPPEKINGIMLTGLGTPSKNSNFTYPVEFKKWILETFPDYDVDFGEDSIDKKNPESVLPKIEKVTKSQIELTKWLFENERWDFFVSVFRSLDVIQHFFINDDKVILKYYKELDEFVGWILENMEESDTLIICSDHGFSYSHTNFNVNAWLKQKGYLNVRPNKFRYLHNILPSIETIKRLVTKSSIGKRLAYYVKNSEIFTKYILKMFPSKEIDIEKIDWDNTKAYFWDGSFGLIYLNLKGREPRGIVDIAERDRLINSIINDLKELKDPKTGQSPIRNVYRGDVFYGSDNINIPDIVLERNKGYCIRSGLGEDVFTKKEEFPGDHDVDGIFFAIGPNIQEAFAVSNVTKVAYFVLSLFGINFKKEVFLKDRTKNVISQLTKKGNNNIAI